MSTYDELMDHCASPHNWMLFPAGWSAPGDWPNLPPAMRRRRYSFSTRWTTHCSCPRACAADRRIAAYCKAAGAPEAHCGEFYPDPTALTHRMQENAFGWLKT